MSKLVLLTLVVSALILPVSGHTEPVYYKDTETLPYTVLLPLGENSEIRQYPAAIAVASTGSEDSGAFSLLFNYISGDNRLNQDISMTAPVETGRESNQSSQIAMTAPVEISARSQMRFFLPSKYTMETAPQPIHPNVALIPIEARQVAAIRYSGFDSEDKRAANRETLIEQIEANGYKVSGEPSYLGYDSPFTLPWNKRHEVIIAVTKD